MFVLVVVMVTMSAEDLVVEGAMALVIGVTVVLGVWALQHIAVY